MLEWKKRVRFRKHRCYISLLFSFRLWQQRWAGNEGAVAQQMGGWLMVESCRGTTSKELLRRGECCGG
ncbi:hypothetical protein PBY51_011427 [Eleginops maclovinus]|uniref:Uncharacterized protein n=1 Tax=Eleginops maclovinus TaxID=56733 RepID=A0AAN7XTY1_ELEMC|nr:hypothetical protein PBY51_011427 [Eleginops maclovinus]